MPHIYIPELSITQDEYDMIQDNQVPIDVFIANKVRNEELFVYIQEPDTTNFTRARNYTWCPELESRVLSENPDKGLPICDI